MFFTFRASTKVTTPRIKKRRPKIPNIIMKCFGFFIIWYCLSNKIVSHESFYT